MGMINAINGVSFGAKLKINQLSYQKKNIIDDQVKAKFEEITTEYPDDVLQLDTSAGKLNFYTQTYEDKKFEENFGYFSQKGTDKLIKLPKEEIANKLKALLVATRKSHAVYERGPRILASLENFLGDSENYYIGDEIEEAYSIFWQAFKEKKTNDITDELSKDPILNTISIA